MLQSTLEEIQIIKYHCFPLKCVQAVIIAPHSLLLPQCELASGTNHPETTFQKTFLPQKKLLDKNKSDADSWMKKSSN